MTVANPREVPEYELNPLELQIRKSDGITKVWIKTVNFQCWNFDISENLDDFTWLQFFVGNLYYVANFVSWVATDIPLKCIHYLSYL